MNRYPARVLPVTLVMSESSGGVFPRASTVTPIPVGRRTAFAPITSRAPAYATVDRRPGVAIDWKSGSPATAVDPADSTVPAAGTAMPAESPAAERERRRGRLGRRKGRRGRGRGDARGDQHQRDAHRQRPRPPARRPALPDDGPHLVDGALRIAARTERNRELNRCDMAEPSPSGRHALASGVSGVLMVNNIDRCHSLMSDQGQASPTNEREFAARKPPN